MRILFIKKYSKRYNISKFDSNYSFIKVRVLITRFMGLKTYIKTYYIQSNRVIPYILPHDKSRNLALENEGRSVLKEYGLLNNKSIDNQ